MQIGTVKINLSTRKIDYSITSLNIRPKEKNMNYYESMIILSPDLKEEQVNQENQKIAELIEKQNGSIEKTDYMGKRTLAYPIRKKGEGYYIVNYFNLPPTELGVIENHYKLSESILRYNILRREEKEA